MRVRITCVYSSGFPQDQIYSWGSAQIRCQLFTAQLQASHHITCLHLPQRRLLEKEEFYLKRAINFTQIQGFQRRPVAHTCGCVLELSVHYDSYPDLSSDEQGVRV